MRMQVIGIDSAFSNMGLCAAYINTQEVSIKSKVEVTHLTLVTTEGQDKKIVRKSSDDLRRARDLHSGLTSFIDCHHPRIAFAEVPHGSQSARASWALGIAVGVLACCPVPIIQVSALEVKMASVGRKSASKDDMIEWAVKQYPNLNWARHNKKITKANEHLADAVATLYAGVNSLEFKQLIAMTEEPAPRKRTALYSAV